MTASFSSNGKKLLIDGKPVIKAWESFSGWYWFATEKVQVQDSDLGNGEVIKNDTIWYGYVQGIEEEWGDFSEGELQSLVCDGKAWRIKEIDLPTAGRRNAGGD